ncbi:MAG TPA: LUD domain-containing protein [Verrucomicrobiae bacterium]|nr:LUD domain-containing protein [Verrucomicrobiae bacterium]
MDVARDNILDRVRAALHVEAHRPPPPTSAPIFPPVTNPEVRFREEFAALKGELIENGERLAGFLKGFLKIATDGSDLVGKAIGGANASARECDLGVTSCDCLVAQTGSIIVSTLSAGGRALSVLPPTHLVIARHDQIVPDLAAAMDLLRKRYNKHWPSALSVITGPSRTADIEKILVMGAHGPKRLALYFVD